MTRVDLRRRLACLRGMFLAGELPKQEYRLLRQGAALAYAEYHPSNAFEGLDKHARYFARLLGPAKEGRPRVGETCNALQVFDEHARYFPRLLGPGEEAKNQYTVPSNALEGIDHNARYFARQYFEAERAEDVRA